MRVSGPRLVPGVEVRGKLGMMWREIGGARATRSFSSLQKGSGRDKRFGPEANAALRGALGRKEMGTKGKEKYRRASGAR